MVYVCLEFRNEIRVWIQILFSLCGVIEKWEIKKEKRAKTRAMKQAKGDTRNNTEKKIKKNSWRYYLWWSIHQLVTVVWNVIWKCFLKLFSLSGWVHIDSKETKTYASGLFRSQQALLDLNFYNKCQVLRKTVGNDLLFSLGCQTWYFGTAFITFIIFPVSFYNLSLLWIC